MRLLRLLPILPLLGGLSTAGAVVAVGPSTVGCASAASVHHAALVIEHGDGTTLEYCIGFDSGQVSGQQLLDDSGVEKAEQAYGSTGQAVCQLDHEPQQYPPGCWSASSPYWAMYVSRGGGAWSSSSLGISSQTFADGDAEGFRYEGQSAYLAPASPAGICPVATSPPTPKATPRSTPRSNTTAAAQQPAASSRPGSVTGGPVPIVSPPAGATARPNSSATPDVVVVAGPSAVPPASSFTPGAGVIAGGGLAAAMLTLLVVQAVRRSGRRRSASSAP